jgi:hypothetical protein
MAWYRPMCVRPGPNSAGNGPVRAFRPPASTSGVESGSWHVGAKLVPGLSPVPKSRLSSTHLVQLKGVSRGVREAGRGAAPAGFDTQSKRPGGTGAPPGLTTKPCQELADGPDLLREAKARPAAVTAANEQALDSAVRGAFFDALSLRYLSACWRAERRPPWSRKDRGTIGLRFSARHPLRRSRTQVQREILAYAIFLTVTSRGKESNKVIGDAKGRGRHAAPRACTATSAKRATCRPRGFSVPEPLTPVSRKSG